MLLKSLILVVIKRYGEHLNLATTMLCQRTCQNIAGVFNIGMVIKSLKLCMDIQYMKIHFPNTEFIKFENMGHGSMASLYPVKWLINSEI